MTQLPPEFWPVVCRLATGHEWPPRGEADVAAFFKYAQREKLLALLMADDGLPDAVRAAKPRFRALDALYRRRYELNRDAALELSRVLGADAFLFYKGTDYRHRLYDHPAQRSMNDIDVYIPRAQLPDAVQKLEAAGYPRKYSYLEAFAPGNYEINVAINDVLVELHRSFSQPVRAAVDYEGLWRRRERFERDGVSGYRMSPSDVILAHAFSLAKDEFSSELSRFLDFYLLLQRYDGELDICVARAKDWQIQRPLYGALHITTTLFPGAATDAASRAMDALLDAPTRQFLRDRVLRDPTSERSGWVSGRGVQLRRKFALIDRRWRRVGFVAYQIYSTLGGLVMEWRARRGGLKMPSRSEISNDDGDAAVDARKMKPGINWKKMSISLGAAAGAAFFFWRASQVGLSGEKIIDTLLAVILGGIALLAFIFQ